MITAREQDSNPVLWAGAPHKFLASQKEKEDNGCLQWITIRMDRLHEWQFEPEFIQALFSGELFSARLTPHDAEDFNQWVEFIREDGREQSIAHFEIRSRLLRLQAAFLKGDRPGEANTVHSKVLSMLSFIASHYTDNLLAKHIAEAADLHPNYAMSLFQKSFGTTIMKYLLELRMSHAIRLLITTDLNITEDRL